ncbi:glycoside hydrolase family 2 TIM barrel-domain containing protein [Pedobacter sp. ok626]|uniref:glycoside hydrolase family 2 TIM barrel-domain containing protein n=1 Tax=Pedobacter sp. ok626 TaxID=1761882 RepID=UPI000B87FCB8|nr:glycoside hydrolase family 2 TIM barrel-domain containing protein [Pedobacter sp. ok626]
MNPYKTFQFLLYCLLVIPQMLLAQQNDWENPQQPSFNNSPAHAHFIPGEAAKLSLDGMWRFKLVQNPSLRSLDFFKRPEQTKNWSQIKVPANWQTEGFDKYIFTDVEYPIPPNPPFVPKDYNPVGSYQREFTIDPSWIEKQIFIHLGAVNSFYYLWINGQYIGFSKDSKTPTEFDITKALKTGRNTVSLQVFRFSDATYLEGQDMWKLSGIERSVYLIARPVFHLFDFRVTSTLDAGYKDGLLSLTVDFNKTPGQKEQGSLKAELLDASGKVIYQSQQPIKTDKRLSFQTKISNVKSWNAEHPNLYQLKITHLNQKGLKVESIVHSLGFRTVEVKKGLFLVNGVPIKIKGVNRHEFNMNTAKVITEADMLLDIRRMKEMNINAVRTSHYPNAERWYALCDKYGLYVVDEANIECDGMSLTPLETLSDKPIWKKAYLDRVQRMWERDKNFTCIVTWSLGNESGFGENLMACYTWLKANDDSRPVQYEAAKDERYSDIFCPMYKSITVMENYVKTWRNRPLIQCEYAHMMGNSGGNLKDDWDLIYKYPQLQGGFVWDFCDQTFAIKDKKGNKIWGFGRDMGTVGLTSDTSFCADGLLAADRSFHPQAYELQKVYQNVGFEAKDLGKYIFRITNRFDFTNLANYKLNWLIKGDGRIVAQGNVEELSLLPGEAKDVGLNVPSFMPKRGVVYYISLEFQNRKATALLPAGFVIAKEQFMLPIQADVEMAMEKEIALLALKNDNGKLLFSGKGFAVGFNQKTGLLESYRVADKELIQQALEPHFWRAATDNDIGNSLQIRSQAWQNAFKTAQLKGLEYTKISASAYKVETVYSLPSVDANVNINYEVKGDGDVVVDYQLKTGKGKYPEPQRIGMRVILNPSYDQVSWLGRGPYDNYIDRNYASAVDLYKVKANALFYPYPRAQESGYRTDVSWAALQNPAGTGLMAIGKTALSIGVLHFDMKNLDYDRDAKENIHGGSMVDENLIWWNIDFQQMGIGGDNSWGAQTHPQYRLPYKDYRYSFTLRPVFSKEILTERAKD